MAIPFWNISGPYITHDAARIIEGAMLHRSPNQYSRRLDVPVPDLDEIVRRIIAAKDLYHQDQITLHQMSRALKAIVEMPDATPLGAVRQALLDIVDCLDGRTPAPGSGYPSTRPNTVRDPFPRAE